MNRARATTKESLSKYFDELHRIMEKYDLLNKPNSIHNMDETNINAGHKPPKVANTRAKSKTNVISSQRIATTTLIARGNAAGRALRLLHLQGQTAYPTIPRWCSSRLKDVHNGIKVGAMEKSSRALSISSCPTCSQEQMTNLWCCCMMDMPPTFPSPSLNLPGRTRLSYLFSQRTPLMCSNLWLGVCTIHAENPGQVITRRRPAVFTCIYVSSQGREPQVSIQEVGESTPSTPQQCTLRTYHRPVH